MTPTPADIFDNPDWHLMGFEGESATFVPMTSDHFRRSSFLDRRIEAAGAPISVPLNPLLGEAAGRKVLPCGWIFHVAHCGSTLLSRLLDRPPGLVLREPPALRQLGIEAGSDRRGPRWDERLRLATLLAARRYDPAIPTVVKTNVPVNFMLADLAALQPASRAVMLHFDLEPYLLAILHSPQHRAWVERITLQLAPSLPVIPAGAPTPIKAAALWLGQTRRFADLANGGLSALRLDADRFFHDPAAQARLASAHLTNGVGQIVADPDDLLSHYSKSPDRAFGEQDRHRLVEASRQALSDDIDAARHWLAEQDNVPTPEALPELA